MKRTPLKRKTPLRSHVKTKSKSTSISPVSKRRAREIRTYAQERQEFLSQHPNCPVTGSKTTQIHHSAGREGGWLNLKRYWIAVSSAGHEYIHRNPAWAVSVGLTVYIHRDFASHLRDLRLDGEDVDAPVFYEKWNGVPFGSL